jgi:hypothetical protein
MRLFHPDPEHTVAFRSRRDASGVSIELEPQTERYVLRIKEPAQPTSITLERGGAPTTPAALAAWPAFDGAAEGWYYDPSHHYLWVRFATDGTGAKLSYATAEAKRSLSF